MMESILREGLEALSLPTEGIPALLRYWELLAEKNKVMNLTAITDPAEKWRGCTFWTAPPCWSWRTSGGKPWWTWGPGRASRAFP